MDEELANAIRDRIPQYNDYLLREFMHEQIEKAPKFIEMVFTEALKLFGGAITYNGYKILPPETRAEIEMDRNQGCRVAISELMLVSYEFIYDNKKYPILLYLPYLYNDTMVIDDTKFVIIRSIREQIYSRLSNGIMIKVIRQPIPFYQTVTYRLESLSDDWFQIESVPTTSIHNLKRSNRRKMIDATIIHYLLCKFGFLRTLERFGLEETDCIFTNDIVGDTDTYRYFAARQRKKNVLMDIYLKVRKDKLKDPIVRKLVASILYTVTGPFPRYPVENFYEPTGRVFRIMLGIIINGAGVVEVQTINKINDHIASLDTYLDPNTQQRLATYNVVVQDIYDLLQYIFCNLTQIILTTLHTDLYKSRIDVLEEIIVETISRAIYNRWYLTDRDTKHMNPKEVPRIMNIPRDLIKNLKTSRIVQKNPARYNDNALIGYFIGKLRHGGLANPGRILRSPDHRFDPSMAVVESLIAFSKSSPGAAGAINPYLTIEKHGGVIRPDYADEIDALGPDLPYQ